MLLRSLAFLIIWSETSHKAEPSEGSQAQKRAKVEDSSAVLNTQEQSKNQNEIKIWAF